MSTLTIIIILGILTSFAASTLIVAASMLSSRISQRKGITERYDRVLGAPQAFSHLSP